MLSTRADPARPLRSTALSAALLAVAVAAGLFAVAAVSVAVLPWSGQPHVVPAFTGPGWLGGWAQWDSGWYVRIATDGYSYVPGQQSTVVFFPAYPLLMRLTGGLVGDTYLAGILVTLAAGVGAATLFAVWLRDRLGAAAAWSALLLFVLYPYSFFLFGAVYADAVFVVAAIGAFVLLERDRPWLAGMAAAVATAARPMGMILVVGLVLRALERRLDEVPAQPGDETPAQPGAPHSWWSSAGVLVALVGVGAFSLYLWSRFGDPLAFLTGQEAWHQQAGPATWFKVQFFRDVTDVSSPLSWLSYVAHPVLTVVGLALVPGVFRRFGRAYGVYALLMIGLSALATKNFFGMSRYLLAAFPVFAVAGDLVADRPVLRRAAPAVSGIGLVLLTAAFARGYYLS
ncbi:MAG: hypothetical protein QOJ69_1952 [Actinomycetota bacterium]|nr:hypothetical protein [Actinomycetota bacterium]